MNDQNRYSQVVIIGGTGQIGHRFIEYFLKNDNTIQIIATSRQVIEGNPESELAKTVINKITKWAATSISTLKWIEFDLDRSTTEFQKNLNNLKNNININSHTLFIIAAAFTNVEACEIDPEKCKRINHTNTERLLMLANALKAKIVFYSTDYVFDGKNGPYLETHSRCSVNEYGHSKVKIEEWLEKNSQSSLIIRTTGVFDYIPGTKSFVMQMLDYWGKGQKTKIPSDQYSNPIWAKDIVTATVKLLEFNSDGIFGVGGSSYLSRFEFAKLISEVLDTDNSLIEPTKTIELNQKAIRPLLGGLKNNKLMNTTKWQPMNAKDALTFLRDHVMKEY